MGSGFTGLYDDRLVAISILISMLAACATLDLAERVSTARKTLRVLWLYGGAVAMGIGIWSMHYVGMLAFNLPTTVLYDWPTVLLSLFTAIVASGAALFIVSRETMGLGRALVGSVLLGGGIAAMHYIGMAAMRLRAARVYSPGLVALSIVLAVVISFAAVQVAFASGHRPGKWGLRKVGSGILLGLAIPITHYVGMAAMHFKNTPYFNGSLEHAIPISPFGVTVIIVATILFLGHVYMVSAVNRHIAEQAQQLIQSGGELHAIFNNLMDGILVMDKENKLIQMNPAAQRILGLPAEIPSLDAVRNMFTMHQPDGSLLPPDEWPGERARHGDYVRDLEIEVRSSYTGNVEMVEISAVPAVSESGETMETILTFRPVTERKHSDEMRSRMAAIVESSQDAIIGKDLNGIVTSWNLGAEKIFGYEAGEIVGKSIHCLLPGDRQQEEDGILERIRSGQTVSQLETMRVRKDGKQIQVSLMICPIRDRNNKIVGASKIARDITETRHLERQLRQSQKMEAIGQLTGGIAHDFNNLLAIVIGNLTLMERLIADNEDAMKRLRPAQKAAARGADLTKRLLALASKEELNPIVLHVEDAIRETVELVGRALGPEIKIFTRFDKEIPPVFADASGLENALLNLAVNARDAMPHGGTLTFEGELAKVEKDFPGVQSGELQRCHYVRIAVSDTGHGMSKETMERALEPFFTTKERNKGTGLGLAMVYGFARQSGGTIRLYSEVDFGTTVSIYLPLAGDIKPESIEIPQLALTTLAGGTVLVVDDETDLLEIARAYLTEMGYSALTASNAATALTTIAQYKEIDLMVTDIIMPGGMNGVEMAVMARELNPNLKVIYSSGFPADALMEKNGTVIDGPLLRKPYHRAEFSSMVQRMMETT
jgi:PAS domain S-box-containing protein